MIIVILVELNHTQFHKMVTTKLNFGELKVETMIITRLVVMVTVVVILLVRYILKKEQYYMFMLDEV